MVSRNKIHSIPTIRNEPKIRNLRKNYQNTIYQKRNFGIYLRNYFNKHIYNTIACLVLILSIFVSGDANVVQAQELEKTFLVEQTNSCTPVDLVFVVDQSRQMSFLDPKAMRVDSIKWLINFLGFDRLLHCPSITHRVAVISFNDVASVDLQLTSINPDPNSADPWGAWKIQYNEIIAPIRANNASDRSISSLQEALENATKLLSEAPTIGTSERKKAIVLIMGGGGSSCPDQFCPIYEVDRDKKLLLDILKSNTGTGLSLWAITYGSDNKYKFNEFWEQATNGSHGNLFTYEEGGVTTGKALLNIFLSLSPRSDVNDVCETVYIDPFLDKVGFNVLLDSPEKDIKFQAEEGSSSEQMPDSILASSTEGTKLLYKTDTASPLKSLYYLYGYPVPGQWEINADCNNNRALVIVQLARSKRISIVAPLESLPQYEEADQLFDPESPYYLRIRVEDMQGVAIKEYQSYQAVGVGKVVTPDGKEYELTFRYENGVYISKESLWVTKKGDYGVSIDLRIPSADPNFSGQSTPNIHFEGKYTVAPLIPFALQIESPISSTHVPVHGNLFYYWLKVRPIDVKVRLQLRSSDDSIVPLDGILRGDPKKAVRIVLYYPASQSTEEVWLEPSPTDPLLFVGKIGGELASPGDYSMKTSFEGQYDTEKFRLASSPASERIEFHRADGVLETPMFYYFWIFILIIIIMWFAWQEVWKRSNLAKGYLLFIPPGQEVKPFAVLELSEQKRRKVIYDQDALCANSWLLSNLVSITADTPSLFGDTQKFTVIEKIDDKEVPKEILVEKDSEKTTLINTSVEYKIQYSALPPQRHQFDQLKQ